MRHLAAGALGLALITSPLGGAPDVLQVRCGTDRWPVKMWDDRDALSVDTIPIATSISELARMPIPEVAYPNDRRMAPHELRVYRVRVIIDQIRTEDDGDWHLTLRDPVDSTQMLVAEIPAPACAKNALNAQRYSVARDSLRRVPRKGLAIVTGIGFWDFIHNQRGAARNGFELHPVLAIVPMRTGR